MSLRTLTSLILAAVFLACCVALWFLLRPDPRPVERATGLPSEVAQRPPLIPQGNEVAVADSAGNVEVISVPDGTEVAIAVTIEPDTTDSEPVQLLIDARKARWFPDLSLIRSSIGVRTVDPGHAPRVTIVRQRMAILALERVPHIGFAYDGEASAFAGVSLVRIWFVHFGGGLQVIRSDPVIRPVGTALVQVRDHLYAGAAIGAGRNVGALVTYGF